MASLEIVSSILDGIVSWNGRDITAWISFKEYGVTYTYPVASGNNFIENEVCISDGIAS